MAANKRKRKQKVRRQAAKTQRELGKQRRTAMAEAVHLAEVRASALYDPETPASTVAELIEEEVDGDPVLVGLAPLLAHIRGSLDEVQEIARHMWEMTTSDANAPSLAALTFGARTRYLAGDVQGARSALNEAFDRVSDDDELQIELIRFLGAVGRPAEALEALGGRLGELVDDEHLNATYRYAIEEIGRRLGDDPPKGECPCGTGLEWLDCCKPRDAGALERFGDRDGVYALRDALREFVESSDYHRAVVEYVLQWLDTAGASAVDASRRDAFERLAFEHAWLVAGITDDEDDETDNPLLALASDSGTDPDIVDYATAWHDLVQYGLWQVRDPSPSPGLDLFDICTGRNLYVAFAPEQTEQIARWTVLAGAIVPIDGAWRATGTMIAVTPTEADSLAELIHSATESVVDQMSGGHVRRTEAQRAPFGRAEPHGVYAYDDDRADPSVASLISRVIGSMLPRLLHEVESARSTPPTMTNTDGDVMELITARLSVSSIADATEKLAGHPDFSVDDDGSAIAWFGREVPAAQRQTMLAEARAKFGASAIDQPDKPQRWVRGTLAIEDDVVKVEVNSRARLDRLMTILGRLGVEPVVLDETRLDPGQDMAWPARPRPAVGGAAPAAEGWEKQWLDESAPMFGGLTPRAAARSVDYTAHVEAMLRQFEYDADTCRFRGEKGVDTDWLREALDMPSYY